MKPKKRREYLEVRRAHYDRLAARASMPAKFLSGNRKPGSLKK